MGLDLATRACSGNKVAEHFVRSCDLCADDQPEAGDHVKLAPREFFSWQDPSGGADFAYDSTFGCSMQNDVRKKWAAHWARLVRPGGRLMTLMYPVAPPGQGRVPPFPGERTRWCLISIRVCCVLIVDVYQQALMM